MKKLEKEDLENSKLKERMRINLHKLFNDRIDYIESANPLASARELLRILGATFLDNQRIEEEGLIEYILSLIIEHYREQLFDGAESEYIIIRGEKIKIRDAIDTIILGTISE